MDGMWAGVGFHTCDGRWGEGSEVEDAPNPACRAECFPDQKCSQPKAPPAWLPPECLPEECPPPKWPPPEWPPPPPCCAFAGARRQITDSRIGRMRSDRRRKAVRVAMTSHPGNVVPVYSCSGGPECVTLSSQLSGVRFQLGEMLRHGGRSHSGKGDSTRGTNVAISGNHYASGSLLCSAKTSSGSRRVARPLSPAGSE